MIPHKKQFLADVVARWNAGKSSSVVAAEFGITRNAVIGIVHRHKGEKRVVYAYNPRKGKSAPRKPRPTREPEVMAMPEPGDIPPLPRKPEGAPKSTGLVFIANDPRDIVNVTGCRWPVMDNQPVPGNYLFCNAGRNDMKSYCPYHESVKVRAA